MPRAARRLFGRPSPMLLSTAPRPFQQPQLRGMGEKDAKAPRTFPGLGGGRQNLELQAEKGREAVPLCAGPGGFALWVVECKGPLGLRRFPTSTRPYFSVVGIGGSVEGEIGGLSGLCAAIFHPSSPNFC